MDSEDVPQSNNPTILDFVVSENSGNMKSSNDELLELQIQAMSNLQKPNVPNVNVPEKIILCLDVCYANPGSLYCFTDGTMLTPINMMKRVLEFFLYTKNAINKQTQFALVTLKDTEPCWEHDFTNNVKDVVNVLNYVNTEESPVERFDFKKLFHLIKSKIHLSENEDSVLVPSYVVRMIVIFGRSNSVPIIPHVDPVFLFFKKHQYFFVDILLNHEEDCANYLCEDIYDALQDLDDGYSYVFEVSRNTTKIHDCIAKLLAHPLQRPLQKNTHYCFSCRH